MSSSRTDELRAIAEPAAVAADQFREEIVPGAQPVVIRGIAHHWPLVVAAREGPHKERLNVLVNYWWDAK